MEGIKIVLKSVRESGNGIEVSMERRGRDVKVGERSDVPRRMWGRGIK